MDLSKRLLITGGAGFIGSHTCELAISMGYAVTILDNFEYGKPEWVPEGVTIINGDIRDMQTCKNALRGIDSIVHLAAMSRSGPSTEMIDTCESVNVEGTLNLLKASRELGIQKFVYSASSTHYGNGESPQTVDMAPDLLNPYGLTKHVAELWVQLFSRIYGLNTTVLRFFNVYGPRQPSDGVYGLVIGIFISAKNNNEPLKIHGEGTQRRDFVHVRDVSRGIMAAVEYRKTGEIFNIGSGANASVKEIADMISPSQEKIARRAGDAEITLADVQLTKERLDWEAKVSLAEGIRELVSFEEL